jgi:cobalt-zinc-cadmium efflux system outer membrane protein
MWISSMVLLVSAQQWTESSVVAKFLEQSPIVRESRARVAIAEAETRGRSAYANPTVSLSHEGAGRTDFFQASQALALTGRIGLVKQAGLAQAKAIEAEGEFSLWQARCGVRQSFYRMLAVQEKMKALSESITALDRVIGILKLREQEGEGSKLDRLRAEREREELLAEVGMLDAMLAGERGGLLGFLPEGVSVERVEGVLGVVPRSTDTTELLARALGGRADLQAEGQRVEQYRGEVRVASRLRYPEPMLQAGLKRAELGPQVVNGPVVGMSVAIPIFQRGQAEMSRYTAEQERATARLEQLRRKVRASLDAALRVYSIRAGTLGKYPANSADLVAIATLAYQEGETGILQLLDAYRVERQTRARRIELEAAVREAWIQVESVVGEELP